MTAVAEDMQLQVLRAWAAPNDGMPLGAVAMLRKRLCHFHLGQELEQIPEKDLMEHLQVIEWAWSAGFRLRKP